jgi:hypothetical protein
MNPRFSPWWGIVFASLVGLLVACLAVLAVFAALIPSIPLTLFNQPQPAVVGLSPVPPTLQATANVQCSSGDCANACLSKLTSFLQSNSAPETSPRSAGQRSGAIKPVVLASYRIENGQLSAPQLSSNVPFSLSAYQQDTASQQKVWSYFTAIIPADKRSQLVEYIVSTDGKGNMLASVDQSSNHPESWALDVDIADAGRPKDLTFTLLHEFGHLLTLDSSQVTPDPALLANPDSIQAYQQETASCPQFLASGGCSKPDSYLNQFFQAFWTKIFSEWSQVNATKGESNYADLLTHFYRNHPTQFITPYASTSPEEDIAESWSYFVLTPKPANDSTAHAKVLFFYNYPELVDLRNQIISGICNYASSQ